MPDFTEQELLSELKRREQPSGFSEEELQAELAKRAVENPSGSPLIIVRPESMGQRVIDNLPEIGAKIGGFVSRPLGAAAGRAAGIAGKNIAEGIQKEGLQEYATRKIKDIGRAAVENLPAEGMVIGGMMGGPVGAAAGGGLGAAGKQIIRGVENQGMNYVSASPSLGGGQKSIENMVQGAAQGATYEMAGPLASRGLAAGIKVAGKVLGGAAERMAVRAAGPFRIGKAKITEATDLQKLGRAGLEEGLVSAGDSATTIAEKSAAKQKELGQTIGNIYTEAESKILHPENWKAVQEAGFNPVKDTALLKDKIARDVRGHIGGAEALNSVEKTLDEIALNGETVTLQRANELKGEVDALINWEGGHGGGMHAPSPTVQKLTDKALKDIRFFIQNKIEAQIAALEKTGTLSEGTLKTLKDANARYGPVVQLKNIAAKRSLANQVNAIVGLRDTIVGGAVLGGATAAGGAIGGDVEGAAKGAGAALTFGLLRRFGPAISARALDITSKAITENPVSRQLIKKSPELLEKMIYTNALKVSNEQEKP